MISLFKLFRCTGSGCVERRVILVSFFLQVGVPASVRMLGTQWWNVSRRSISASSFSSTTFPLINNCNHVGYENSGRKKRVRVFVFKDKPK